MVRANKENRRGDGEVSIRSIIINKPLMDYPRVFLAPIVDNVAKKYDFTQLYPNFIIVDLLLWNHDSTNGLVYRVNDQPFDLICPASQAIVWNNIIIWKIEILSNVSYEMQIFGLPRDLIMGR